MAENGGTTACRENEGLGIFVKVHPTQHSKRRALREKESEGEIIRAQGSIVEELADLIGLVRVECVGVEIAEQLRAIGRSDEHVHFGFDLVIGLVGMPPSRKALSHCSVGSTTSPGCKENCSSALPSDIFKKVPLMPPTVAVVEVQLEIKPISPLFPADES